jgi:hypothetical protein
MTSGSALKWDHLFATVGIRSRVAQKMKCSENLTYREPLLPIPCLLSSPPIPASSLPSQSAVARRRPEATSVAGDGPARVDLRSGDPRRRARPEGDRHGAATSGEEPVGGIEIRSGPLLAPLPGQLHQGPDLPLLSLLRLRR